MDHVDDYSGTLGGVCKVHISALVTRKFKLNYCTVSSSSPTPTPQKKQEQKKTVAGHWEALDTKVSSQHKKQ